MSLSPPSILATRARSSSTAASLTLASTRARSNSLLHPPSVITPTLNKSDNMINPKSMLAVMVAMAYRAIPSYSETYNDILPTESPSSPTKWDSQEKVDVECEKLLVELDEDDDQLSPPPPQPPTVLSKCSFKRKGHKRQTTSLSALFLPRSNHPSAILPSPVLSPAPSPRSSSPISFHVSLPSPPPPKLVLPLIFVCSLFFISFAPVVLGVYSLPIHSLKSLPRTLADIDAVAKELKAYFSSGLAGQLHVLAILSLTSIWKNTWSIPGSALLNVLAGALMNPIYATILQTVLTTIGSLFSTLLSKPLAPIISKVFPRALEMTRAAFEGRPTSPSASDELPSADEAEDAPITPPKTPIWVRLTVLRLVGIVPWSGLNLVCGVCDVPLRDCALGAFIGVLPWTAVTCQVGDILQTFVAQKTSDSLTTTSDATLSSLLTSPSIIGKLVFLSLLSLGPILLRERLTKLVKGKNPQDAEKSESP